jgi:CRISPR-associated protein Cas1
MSNVLYISSPCYISSELNQLCLKKIINGKPEASTTRPAEDLVMLVLENQQITITQAAIQLLMRHQVALIACDEKHLPTALMLPLEGHTLQGKHQQAQFLNTSKLAGKLWQQVITAKVTNQVALLETIGEATPTLNRLIKSVESSDKSAIEGQVARIYFPKLFGEQFLRDADGQTPNPHLNFGYAIMRSMMARAIVGAGLHLCPGIFHKNQYNPFPLADDMMEPYRPIIDHLVFTQMLHNHEDAFHITVQEKKDLVNSIYLDVLIGGTERQVYKAMQQTAVSLAQCYLGHEKQIALPALCL